MASQASFLTPRRSPRLANRKPCSVSLPVRNKNRMIALERQLSCTAEFTLDNLKQYVEQSDESCTISSEIVAADVGDNRVQK